MLRVRIARILCAVFAAVFVAGANAQESPASAPDPLTQAVGSAMDEVADSPAAADRVRDTAPSTVVTMDRVLRTLAALAVVVALILVSSYALRRWGKGVPMLAGTHLGKVLGRIHLERGTAIHFVQVGEKVLLVGSNAGSVSLIAEFAAAEFAGAARVDASPSAQAAAPFNPDSFLAELRAKSAELAGAGRLPREDEDEIATLRGDIQRLQRYLRDENRENED